MLASDTACSSLGLKIRTAVAECAKDIARQTYKLSGVRNGEDLSAARNSCSAR
jgi:hypothetical protein